MAIRFACRNGHLLKADLRQAGRKMKCPRCRVPVWVPQPRNRQPIVRDPVDLTDTQAVRLLGSYHPSQKGLLAAPSPTPGPIAPRPISTKLIPLIIANRNRLVLMKYTIPVKIAIPPKITKPVEKITQEGKFDIPGYPPGEKPPSIDVSNPQKSYHTG